MRSGTWSIYLAPINYNGKPRLFSIVQDISGTKSASRLLKESELRHNRILDCISEGIVAIDANDKIVYANEKAAQVLRLPLDSIIGVDTQTFVGEESKAATSSNLIRRKKGEKGQADYRMRRGDGSEFWASVSANPIFAGGAYEGTVYAVSDITFRKEAELALQESEERFRCLTEGSPRAIAMVTGPNLTYVNPRWVHMFGHADAAEILGRPVLEAFVDRSRPEMEELFRRGMDHGAGTEVEAMVARRDGTELPVTVSATRMRVGEAPAIVAVLTHISERKRAEAALREGEHFVKHILSTDPTGIMVYDLPSSRIVYVNDRVTKVTGRALKDLQGTDRVMGSMITRTTFMP